MLKMTHQRQRPSGELLSFLTRLDGQQNLYVFTPTFWKRKVSSWQCAHGMAHLVLSFVKSPKASSRPYCLFLGLDRLSIERCRMPMWWPPRVMCLHWQVFLMMLTQLTPCLKPGTCIHMHTIPYSTCVESAVGPRFFCELVPSQDHTKPSQPFVWKSVKLVCKDSISVCVPLHPACTTLHQNITLVKIRFIYSKFGPINIFLRWKCCGSTVVKGCQCPVASTK